MRDWTFVIVDPYRRGITVCDCHCAFFNPVPNYCAGSSYCRWVWTTIWPGLVVPAVLLYCVVTEHDAHLADALLPHPFKPLLPYAFDVSCPIVASIYPVPVPFADPPAVGSFPTPPRTYCPNYPATCYLPFVLPAVMDCNYPLPDVPPALTN